MTTCGQIRRTRRCPREAVVVLLIGHPAAQIGACREHLADLVIEYVEQRGSVDVVRPDVLT